MKNKSQFKQAINQSITNEEPGITTDLLKLHVFLI